jgi:predicted secreted protein
LELPTNLTLRAGERISLPLTSAGAVGYWWEMEISGDRSAVAAAVGPLQLPAEPTGEPRGGSAPLALFIEALKPGRAEIELTLRRAVSPPPPPREAHHLVVNVGE